MVIFGRREVQRERTQMKDNNNGKNEMERKKNAMHTYASQHWYMDGICRLIDTYCSVIHSPAVSAGIIVTLATYWYISVVGILQMKAELKPDNLFLADSNITKVGDMKYNTRIGM